MDINTGEAIRYLKFESRDYKKNHELPLTKDTPLVYNYKNRKLRSGVAFCYRFSGSQGRPAVANEKPSQTQSEAMTPLFWVFFLAGGIGKPRYAAVTALRIFKSNKADVRSRLI